MTSHIKQIHIKIILTLRLITVVYEKCALLGYYAASSGNFLQTFRDNLSVLICKGQESKEIKQTSFLDFWPYKMGPDRLSRNVGKKSNPFWGFLTLEDGIDRLSRNDGKKPVLLWILDPWRCDRYVVPKRRVINQALFWIFDPWRWAR